MVQMIRARGLLGIIAALALISAACGSPDDASTSTAADRPAAETQPAVPADAPTTSQADLAEATNPAVAAVCPSSAGAVDTAFTNEVSAVATTLLEREDGLVVQAVQYPHPDYSGKPWSQWGQGTILPDGRYFSAIGDSLARDGNSFVYEYDPQSATLVQIADLLSLVDNQPGAWGYGKVHGQLVQGSCGQIYFSSYWGSRRNIEFADGYRGDILFEIDPAGRQIGALDVILDGYGVPSLSGTSEAGLLYMEAVDPLIPDTNQGSFIAYDTASGEIVFEDDRVDHTGFRWVAVDDSGRAYYSIADSGLALYDPATNTSTDLDVELPGEFLRSATVPGPDGTIYAVTRRPAEFFALKSDGSLTELGPARGYTTSMALSPDGSVFYYVPDAHGGAWEAGTPLIAVDTTTGDETVLVELNPLALDEFGINLGGTYNITLDPTGRTLYIGMNSGTAEEDAFGEVILVIVTLP